MFKYFLWILYSDVVVLVKYNQFKKKKKCEEGRYEELELELNFYAVPDRRYKVNGEESK